MKFEGLETDKNFMKVSPTEKLAPLEISSDEKEEAIIEGETDLDKTKKILAEKRELCAKTDPKEGEDFLVMKREYEEAKAEYVQKMCLEKIDNLKKDGLNEEDPLFQEEMNLFKAELFNEIIIKENERFNEVRINNLPEREQSWFGRLMGNYAKMPMWKKTLISTTVATGALTLGGAIAGVGAGVAFGSYRFARSLIGGKLSKMASGFVKKIGLENIGISKRNKLEMLQGRFDTIFNPEKWKEGNLTEILSEFTQSYNEVLAEVGKKHRNITRWAAVAGILAGGLTAGAIMSEEISGPLHNYLDEGFGVGTARAGIGIRVEGEIVPIKTDETMFENNEEYNEIALEEAIEKIRDLSMKNNYEHMFFGAKNGERWLFRETIEEPIKGYIDDKEIEEMIKMGDGSEWMEIHTHTLRSLTYNGYSEELIEKIRNGDLFIPPQTISGDDVFGTIHYLINFKDMLSSTQLKIIEPSGIWEYKLDTSNAFMKELFLFRKNIEEGVANGTLNGDEALEALRNNSTFLKFQSSDLEAKSLSYEIVSSARNNMSPEDLNKKIEKLIEVYGKLGVKIKYTPFKK